MGIGTKADKATKNSPDVRRPLTPAERDVLRQRISNTVRDRELADAEAWKEKKANGRSAARQQP